MAQHQHILVVSYSQSGQLTRMAEAFVRSLKEDESIVVEHCPVVPQQAFPFPWGFWRFFDTFPETVHMRPEPIRSPQFAHTHYDLVLIAYTVWFLSPSQPITAFLQHESVRALLHDTPVVTLIGCRNMWLMAQEKMKQLLADAGARLVGNVVKTDNCGSAASFITTPAWMFTGKKQAVSWLPEAGIAEAEIEDCVRFGEKIREALQQDSVLDESLLQEMGAVKINEKLIASEKIAQRSFFLWGKGLIKAGQLSPLLRRVLLGVYIVFLVAMICTVVPITALMKILFAPLTRAAVYREKKYFAAPSGE